jgi:hypothetical protein
MAASRASNGCVLLLRLLLLPCASLMDCPVSSRCNRAGNDSTSSGCNEDACVPLLLLLFSNLLYEVNAGPVLLLLLVLLLLVLVVLLLLG